MIPDHEPDEMLFNWLARAERLGGFSSAQAASAAFFGHKTAGLKLDFPSHLNVLVETVPGVFADPYAAADKATTLPYLCRFRPPGIYEHAIEQMSGPSVGRLKFFLGLQANSQSARYILRSCPACREADRARIGMSYWHRTHQLPGTLFCWEHGDLLQIVRQNIQGKQTTLFLPEDVHFPNFGDFPDLDSMALLCARQIAKLSRDALECPLPGGFNEKALYFTYRHGLKDAGFLTSSGRIRVAALSHAMANLLEHLPADVQLGRLGTGRHFDLLLLILRGDTSSHPFPHLVLIAFLFGTWSSFSGVYEWERAMHSSEDGNSAESNAFIVRENPTLQSLFDTSTQGRAKTTDAKKLHKHRSALRTFMKANPDASRKRIAQLCCAAWKWLYRNDREWLEAHLPAPLARGRFYGTWVDWNERDRKLGEHIAEHCKAICFPASERITVVTVLHKMPPIGFSIQLSKMPNSQALLSEIMQHHQLQRRCQA